MEETKTMRVLVVKPGQKAEVIQIRDDLELLQQAVGGYIQAIYPFEDHVAIICNEDGKFDEKCLLNRSLRDEDGVIYDILCGDFLIVGLTADSFGSLSDDLLEKYAAMYDDPEVFVERGGKIRVMRSSDKVFRTFEDFQSFFALQLMSGALKKAKEVLT